MKVNRDQAIGLALRSNVKFSSSNIYNYVTVLLFTGLVSPEDSSLMLKLLSNSRNNLYTSMVSK